MVCGLCGYTTEDLLNEQHSSCIQPALPVPSGRGLKLMLEDDGPIDLAMIMTGTNDLGVGTSPEQSARHVAELHAICHESGVPTVAIAATQTSGQVSRVLRQQLADLIADWASCTDGVLCFLDVEQIVPRPLIADDISKDFAAAAYWEPDDLHLSPVGSVALGYRLATPAATWLQQISKGGFICLKPEQGKSRPYSFSSSPRRCGTMSSPTHVVNAQCVSFDDGSNTNHAKMRRQSSRTTSGYIQGRTLLCH
jgi:hypothetical protein